MTGILPAVFSQTSPFLALGFLDIVWGLLAVVVFFIGLLLIAIILVQESKDAGLTSAFGGGGGGSALLGARMQKGLAKMTTVLAIVFALCVMVMGIIGNSSLERTIGEEHAPADQAIPAAAPEAGNQPDAGAAAGGGEAGGGEAGSADADGSQ